VLRSPSRTPVTVAETTVPPAVSTPTKANCEAPVNISRLRAQVCQTSRPADTDTAPKDRPYTLTAPPTASPSRRAASWVGVRFTPGM
jgi:hypothetical protein